MLENVCIYITCCNLKNRILTEECTYMFHTILEPTVIITPKSINWLIYVMMELV